MYGVERCARASKRHRASQVIMPELTHCDVSRSMKFQQMKLEGTQSFELRARHRLHALLLSRASVPRDVHGRTRATTQHTGSTKRRRAFRSGD